jgi:murein DD-endopeptidase MepM/ murein hydrolase activator NlpD
MGNHIKITHDGTDQGRKIVSYYAHLHNYSIPMGSVGQHVQAGQQIGTIGTTGNSSGPHLHLQLSISGKGKVDPVAYIKMNQNPGTCYDPTTAQHPVSGETYNKSTDRHGEYKE